MPGEGPLLTGAARIPGEALGVPPTCRKSSSDPEATFTPATVVDSDVGTASGGLERVSSTVFCSPGMCCTSEVNSAKKKQAAAGSALGTLYLSGAGSW